jgi:hypothetical protein
VLHRARKSRCNQHQQCGDSQAVLALARHPSTGYAVQAALSIIAMKRRIEKSLSYRKKTPLLQARG